MRWSRRPLVCPIVCPIVSFCLFISWGAQAASSSICLIKPETHEMLAIPAHGLRAFVRYEKKWSEIPVQIDERDRNGDYVLEHGLPFTANGGDDRFNGNDEMVIELPANFSGSREFSDAAARDWLAHLTKRSPTDKAESTPANSDAIPQMSRLKITVGPHKAPVLLISGLISGLISKDLRPASGVDFNPDKSRVTTASYRYQFNKFNPAALGQLDIPSEAAKGSGLTTINRDGGFAIWLKPPWLCPTVTKSYKDIPGAIESWRSGPIRTIVAVGSKYSAFWSLVRAHLFSELVFYRDRFQIPSVIEIPFSPESLLGTDSGFAYGLQMTGKVTSNMDRPDHGPARVSVQHPSGLILTATVDPVLARAGAMPKVWMGDEAPSESQAIPPPVIRWFKENDVTTGFFVDISKMKRGRYDFSLDLQSPIKANQDHTDFLICKSVWTQVKPNRMAPSRTVPAQPRSQFSHEN